MNLSASWREPKGWQCVTRTAGRETLVILHTFGSDMLPANIVLPVQAKRILRVMSSEGNEVTLKRNQLTLELRAPFEAIAVHLK